LNPPPGPATQPHTLLIAPLGNQQGNETELKNILTILGLRFKAKLRLPSGVPCFHCGVLQNEELVAKIP
jgi:hypothetical protein